MSTVTRQTCCICEESTCDGKPTVVLQTKGSDGVNRASLQRGSDMRTVPGELVHVECRRKYCKPDNIQHDMASCQQPSENRSDL